VEPYCAGKWHDGERGASWKFVQIQQILLPAGRQFVAFQIFEGNGRDPQFFAVFLT